MIWLNFFGELRIEETYIANGVFPAVRQWGYPTDQYRREASEISQLRFDLVTARTYDEVKRVYDLAALHGCAELADAARAEMYPALCRDLER